MNRSTGLGLAAVGGATGCWFLGYGVALEHPAALAISVVSLVVTGIGLVGRVWYAIQEGE